MVHGTRVLVVTWRFWPISDDASMRLLHHFSSLQEQGMEVTILTARWQSSWPEFALCRNVPIHRLLPPPTSNWNETHFQRNVVAWIQQSIDQFDVIYVDHADGLLSAIVARASKWKKPVVGRFALEDTELSYRGNHLLQANVAAEACRRCTHILTPAMSATRGLVAQGIPAQRIQCIPDVAWESVPRSRERRRAAAIALMEANGDLAIPNRTSILLHHGRASVASMRPLVEGTCDLLDGGAMLRLWIVGSSPRPEELYQMVRARGWHREILLFESFDDIQELIAAADLAVVSNPAESLQYTLPHCVEAGLTTLLADTRESREYLPPELHHRLYQSPTTFSERFRDWQLDPSRWEQETMELKRWRRNIATSDTCIRSWQTMIHHLSNEMSA